VLYDYQKCVGNQFSYVSGQKQVKNLDFSTEISNNVHYRVAEATFCLHPKTTLNGAEYSNDFGNRCIRNYSKLKNHS